MPEKLVYIINYFEMIKMNLNYNNKSSKEEKINKYKKINVYEIVSQTNFDNSKYKHNISNNNQTENIDYINKVLVDLKV